MLNGGVSCVNREAEDYLSLVVGHFSFDICCFGWLLQLESNLAVHSYWDRGRPARHERETERSGVKRSQPHDTLRLEESEVLTKSDNKK